MIDAVARNLRTAERFLLQPAVPAVFGDSPIQICDLSLGGARFRHDASIATGTKNLLRVAVGDRSRPLMVESVVVWSQPDSSTPGRYVSGLRALSGTDVMAGLLEQLHAMKRTSRIEELRSVDRFLITPALEGEFAGQSALVEDISARGARIETAIDPVAGAREQLKLSLPKLSMDFAFESEIMWTALKSITAEGKKMWRAGLRIDGRSDHLRLVIGHLGAENRCVIDAHSLRLKLRVIRARARQLAPQFHEVDHTGIDPEQFLLVHGVREELRLNPEEAMHWYRRARIVIADPGTRTVAPDIADHPDAIAVWEYLDRSIDPTIVGRAFRVT
jgi:hypothetical protein